MRSTTVPVISRLAGKIFTPPADHIDLPDYSTR